MKRSCLLFLSSFLITILLAAGFYRVMQQHHANDGSVPATQEKPAAVEPAKPEPFTTPAEPVKDTPAATPAVTPSEQPAAAEPEQPATDTPAEEEPAATKGRTPEHSAALSVAQALAAGDPAAALQKLVEKGAITPEAAAAAQTWGATHKVARVEEVGNSYRPNGERSVRYRFVAEDGSEDLLVDVVRKVDGSIVVTAATPVDADKTRLTATSDSLTVAEGFVEAVRRGDMATARAMTLGVSDATVAGLCMIFEEGEFLLREQLPIRNAFENATNSGYIVYVESKLNHFPANIGLAMQRAESWRVSEVSLDALLSTYENLANAEGGRYFPIVKNPQGGDSLALFFGFNEHTLTPRSLRQLQIVAELLKQTGGRLDISGHTDDVGSEKYNQQLSEKRAAAVKEALVSFGVDAAQISTEGMGKSQPRRTYATDDTEQQINYIRGENRRAEIYLDFKS